MTVSSPGRVRWTRALAMVLLSLAAGISALERAPAPAAAQEAEAGGGAGIPGGPLEKTRETLAQTNRIVTGPGTHNEKLARLKELLRTFLDTDALGRQSMGKHLDGRSPAQIREFLELFRDLFIRTYVQRLLLFDVPDFEYGEETVDGDRGTVQTWIVTPRDRFEVSYRLRKASDGWQATDILIEGVSLAANFRSQFDQALAKDSFAGLLEKLRRKLRAKPATDTFG